LGITARKFYHWGQRLRKSDAAGSKDRACHSKSVNSPGKVVPSPRAQRTPPTYLRCCLGLDAIQKGKIDQALAHFRWVKERNDTHSPHFMIALAELNRLEKQEPAKSKPQR
jgi:hypothetical protein